VHLLKEGQITKRDGTQVTLHFATPELAKLFKDSITAMGNKDVWFTTKNDYTFAGNFARNGVRTGADGNIRGLVFFLYLRKMVYDEEKGKPVAVMLTGEDLSLLQDAFDRFNRNHSDVRVGMLKKDTKKNGEPMQGRLLYLRVDFPFQQIITTLKEYDLPLDADVSLTDAEQIILKDVISDYYVKIINTMKALCREIDVATV
jgi:hypothetical protein